MNTKLANWLEKNNVGHLIIIGEETEFRRCSVCGLMADCVEVRLESTNGYEERTTFINRSDAVNIINNDFSGED